MAELRNLVFFRHLRADASTHVLHHAGGALKRSGKGLSFWFLPLSASIAEVPTDDRELSLLVHARSLDYQDVTVQGVVTYRVTDAALLASRIDFTIDLESGAYVRQPLEKLELLLAQLAQQHVFGYTAETALREVLADGYEVIRDRVARALSEDASLSQMGIVLVTVRISSVAPTPELERALEAPARERIQQESDEAAFARRALAVEKERAIAENELANRIELARREEDLVAQSAVNDRRKAESRAEEIALVEGARLQVERERAEIQAELPPEVLRALALQELAGALGTVEHLTVTPDLIGPLLAKAA